MSSDLSAQIIEASKKLACVVEKLSFSSPVSYVYNPLDYAREPHELYLSRYASSKKRVLFLGMNPGPFGMAQTGIPFGEVAAVRDWLRIEAPVQRPASEHPKRPVEGFGCQRSEVSGRRLWGLFRERFGSASNFFEEHFVSNYCPLLFLNERGANLTPDKIKAAELKEVYGACDDFLQILIHSLEPDYLVGVGNFAYKKLLAIAPKNLSVQISKILHPSPASPAANRGWAGAAVKQLEEAGVWA